MTLNTQRGASFHVVQAGCVTAQHFYGRYTPVQTSSSRFTVTDSYGTESGSFAERRATRPKDKRKERTIYITQQKLLGLLCKALCAKRSVHKFRGLHIYGSERHAGARAGPAAAGQKLYVKRDRLYEETARLRRARQGKILNKRITVAMVRPSD